MKKTSVTAFIFAALLSVTSNAKQGDYAVVLSQAKTIANPMASENLVENGLMNTSATLTRYYDAQGRLRLAEGMAFEVFAEDGQTRLGMALFADSLIGKAERELMTQISEKCPVTLNIQASAREEDSHQTSYTIVGVSSPCALPEKPAVSYDETSY